IIDPQRKRKNAISPIFPIFCQQSVFRRMKNSNGAAVFNHRLPSCGCLPSVLRGRRPVPPVHSAEQAKRAAQLRFSVAEGLRTIAECPRTIAEALRRIAEALRTGIEIAPEVSTTAENR